MSNETLMGDDAMAWSFLNNAANAIVARSDLSKQLQILSAQLAEANSALAILTDIKATQEGRIATLETNLESALNSEREMHEMLNVAQDTIANRQSDIDLLDVTVADLRSELSATRTERDDYGLKHLETTEELIKTQGKLDAVIGALEKVGFRVEALVPEEIADGRDDPNYRREPEPSVPGDTQTGCESLPRYNEGPEGAPSGSYDDETDRERDHEICF